MEEVQLTSNESFQVELSSDKNNSYSVMFNLNNSIEITANQTNDIIHKSFSNKYSFEEIRINKYFLLFDTLEETINVMGAVSFFGVDMVTKFKLIEYSLIDYITLLLFYFRMGIVLFIIGIVSNKKIAPHKLTFINNLIKIYQYESVLPFDNYERNPKEIF